MPTMKLMELSINNNIVDLIHKHHNSTKFDVKHSTSAPNERVWRITQLAKLSLNHPSVVLTADVFQYLTQWRFSTFIKYLYKTKSNCKIRRPNTCKNVMGLLLVLREASLLLAVLHIHALRQWVRSVCRSQKKLRNTTTTHDTIKRII